MKKIILMLSSLVFLTVNSAHAEWYEVSNSNPSKLNKYMLHKSCKTISQTLKKNNWQPAAENPSPDSWNSDTFKKYPELEACAGTGLGQCIAKYRKDTFLLSVSYLAEGGSMEGFESKNCGSVGYSIDVR